jgi:hypothetical protein
LLIGAGLLVGAAVVGTTAVVAAKMIEKHSKNKNIPCLKCKEILNCPIEQLFEPTEEYPPDKIS